MSLLHIIVRTLTFFSDVTLLTTYFSSLTEPVCKTTLSPRISMAKTRDFFEKLCNRFLRIDHTRQKNIFFELRIQLYILRGLKVVFLAAQLGENSYFLP